jgi:hypothetical protein
MNPKMPPDPGNMNDRCAECAAAALSTFMKETGTDKEDALADLMHWADRGSHDFDAALDRARYHYEAETAGESLA